MGYFSTSALTQGQSAQGTPLSGTAVWRDTTWTFEWSDATDTSAVAALYGSADGGSDWFVLGAIVYGSPSPRIFTDTPINAVKVTVLVAASGNALTSQVAGL